MAALPAGYKAGDAIAPEFDAADYKKMAKTGPEMFAEGDIPLQQTIVGTVNGKRFRIQGNGSGNANEGHLKGKWINRSGKCPMAWAVLAPTIGYGFKCFAKHDEGVFNYFHACMPAGYTQERHTIFGDHGTMTSNHEVVFREIPIKNKETGKSDLVMAIVNKVSLTADIKEDSPILTGEVDLYIQSIERTIPFENGVKCCVQYFYPIRGKNDFIVTSQTTINRPLGPGRNIQLPEFHFKQTEAKQWKEDGEERDHIVHDEISRTVFLPNHPLNPVK